MIFGLVRTSLFQKSHLDSQIDWIKNVIQQVSERDDTDLVVRIHPREGKVKGGGVESDSPKDAQSRAN